MMSSFSWKTKRLKLYYLYLEILKVSFCVKTWSIRPFGTKVNGIIVTDNKSREKGPENNFSRIHGDELAIIVFDTNPRPFSFRLNTLQSQSSQKTRYKFVYPRICTTSHQDTLNRLSTILYRLNLQGVPVIRYSHGPSIRYNGQFRKN